MQEESEKVQRSYRARDSPPVEGTEGRDPGLVPLNRSADSGGSVWPATAHGGSGWHKERLWPHQGWSCPLMQLAQMPTSRGCVEGTQASPLGACHGQRGHTLRPPFLPVPPSCLSSLVYFGDLPPTGIEASCWQGFLASVSTAGYTLPRRDIFLQHTEGRVVHHPAYAYHELATQPLASHLTRLSLSLFIYKTELMKTLISQECFKVRPGNLS